MILFDKSVCAKTFKVILQAIVISVLIIIFILVIAAAGQQSVYRNMGIDKNAFVDTWEHVWNYGDDTK